MSSTAATDPQVPLPADEGFRRLMVEAKFGMDEIATKLKILREEFTHLHDYNPIEHISCRLKTPDSLREKIARKGIDAEADDVLDQVRARITDLAGVRVTCSFISEVYRVFGMLGQQQDIRVLDVRDYIAHPKPNGYRSLHALVEVPVFLSGGAVPVLVEVQFRTIAMDFWASLEHKIYYKYRREVPPELLAGLHDAAETAYALDVRMESLHQEVQGLEDLPAEVLEQLRSGAATALPEQLLASLRRLGGEPTAPPTRP
ncbi:GTP pyrophosphokinase [Nocardioides ferulae]|uniref:GTP pyrophosphokinase n=1 Tax=Nocardioides ferulae TaxID=2340821 RepID=UPI001F0C413F|nr:GTP pyrophosphokinase family protein [Nocardioides ferulae]